MLGIDLQAQAPRSSPDAVAPMSLLQPEPAGSKLRTMMMRSSPFAEEAEPPAAPPPVAAPVAAPVGNRTMLGISMDQAPAASSPSPFADDEPTTRGDHRDYAAGRAGPGPAPTPAALPPSPAYGASAGPAASPAAAAPAARQPQRTMLGLPGPVIPGGYTPPAAAPQAPRIAPAPDPHAAPVPGPSAFGSPVGQPVPLAAAPMPAAPMPAAPMPAAPMPAPMAAPMPAPMAAAAPAASPPAPAQAPAPSAPAKKMGPSHRTMLGVAAPSLEAPPQAAPQASPSIAPALDDTTGELSVAGLPSPRRRNTGCLVAVLALGVLVATGALGAFAYSRFWGRGPEVHASVAQGAQGEVLRLEVPGAAAGTSVRYAGQERPVTNGSVDLPLAADVLHLGDNQLVVELVAAGAAPVTVPITLTVEYRVRSDLAGLEAAAPVMHVVVEAIPGSTVTVGGQPVALDAEGRSRLEVPIASLSPGADGALSHVAPYVVTPPGGAPSSGSLTTRIPVARLELRYPLDGATTDRASLEVAGRTAPGSQVTVEGTAAPVGEDGTFRVEVPLPSSGAEPRSVLHVVARRAGAAPRSVELGVRRVPDLRRAASEVVVDRTATYARLADASDEVRGRMVAIEGQVYNVDVQDGRGVLQMLARGCDRADRCPVWVTYAPAGPIEAGAVVRVVGVASGTQQFRAESAEVRTVPRLDATFVVPSTP